MIGIAGPKKQLWNFDMALFSKWNALLFYFYLVKP